MLSYRVPTQFYRITVSVTPSGRIYDSVAEFRTAPTLHSKKRARTEGMEEGMESRKQGNKKEWRVTLYIIGL